MVGPNEKMFKVKVLRRLEKSYFDICFVSTVNTSFDYMLF